jgi:hypothetical protein
MDNSRQGVGSYKNDDSAYGRGLVVVASPGAVPNTGSGGGGNGGHDGTTTDAKRMGGAGASGIVVLMYEVA